MTTQRPDSLIPADYSKALWVQLAARLSEHGAKEFSLVLEAGGIEHKATRDAAGWALSVPGAQAELAAEQLRTYLQENAATPALKPPPAMIGQGWAGVLVYAAVLMAVAVCVRQYAFGLDWLAAGRMDAGALRAGQWWRAVTALTIHLDLDHLGGNMAFGGFFAYYVARYFGAGLGWFAILMSGALGNLLNGLLQSSDHRSIGASTAVFAALALLTANTWRHGFSSAASWRPRVAPLIAGIALLAFTGSGGENTDIGAHLAGFIAGFVLGLGIVRLGLIARGRRLQQAAAWSAAALLTAAWASGLAFGP
jgi:membrane associated rhomboid family serine protease